jgi:LPXTG-motif cell wall-anchored protein
MRWPSAVSVALLLMVLAAGPAGAQQDPFDPSVTDAGVPGSTSAPGTGATGGATGDPTTPGVTSTPPSPDAAPTPSPAPANATETLPNTGADTGAWLVVAYALIASGAGALTLARLA